MRRMTIRAFVIASMCVTFMLAASPEPSSTPITDASGRWVETDKSHVISGDALAAAVLAYGDLKSLKTLTNQQKSIQHYVVSITFNSNGVYTVWFHPRGHGCKECVGAEITDLGQEYIYGVDTATNTIKWRTQPH